MVSEGALQKNSYGWSLKHKHSPDTFLATFIVPILPYILETRVQVRSTELQSDVSIVLSTFGLAMIVMSPFAGILDSLTSRKWLLLAGLVAQIISTGMTAAAVNCKTLGS